jgi:ribonuclease Z
MKSVYAAWRNSVELPGTPFTLSGFSIAATYTNFYVPQLNVLLDAGLPGYMSPSDVFLTHGHSDHAANLTDHLHGTKPVRVYIPATAVEHVDAFIRHTQYMTNNSAVGDSDFNYEIVPVSHGQEIPLMLRGKRMLVRIIDCDHSVPCVGYGFSEIRRKLQPQYADMDTAELRLLKKAGTVVDCDYEFYAFMYVGDTSAAILGNPLLAQYATVIIECTFLEEKDLPRARLTTHIHWLHLKPHVLAHPEQHFVLCHFSRRHTPELIRAFFAAEGISNITPIISE